ncbi:MAG TPA: PIG-L deacetylase family protein [Streptosporangiaceae bacterium]|nr:PIG-L deacetylase family protein [Streptosporangiaceae bacterium]
MPVIPDGEVGRVLVVVAHPDDAEFWLGGTVAGWTDRGIEMSYCVLTDGEGGGFDPGVPREEIPRIRRAEQRRAAELLGVKSVRFLGLPEEGLRGVRRELHEELVRVIRQIRPERVVTWSPEWNWLRFRSCHPDHLATGAVTLEAIYPDASNRFALVHLRDNEGLEPWTVREVWLLNTPQREINHYVDITSTFDRKVAAVRAHGSQIKDPDILADRLRERIAGNTPAAGLVEGRLAEAFQVVVTG